MLIVISHPFEDSPPKRFEQWLGWCLASTAQLPEMHFVVRPPLATTLFEHAERLAAARIELITRADAVVWITGSKSSRLQDLEIEAAARLRKPIIDMRPYGRETPRPMPELFLELRRSMELV